MTNWAVGHNMPGYMPDGDVWITRDWQLAKEALIADLEMLADHIGDPEFDEKQDQDASHAIIRLEEMTQPGEYLCYVGGYAYWINATDEKPDEEAE